MPKLTLEDLGKIKQRVEQDALLRKDSGRRARINVHMGTCGTASGAGDVMAELVKIIEEKGITDVVLTSSGCAGLCSSEPMMTVELVGEPGVKYVKLTPENTREIFESHLVEGKILEKYALGMGPEKTY